MSSSPLKPSAPETKPAKSSKRSRYRVMEKVLGLLPMLVFIVCAVSCVVLGSGDIRQGRWPQDPGLLILTGIAALGTLVVKIVLVVLTISENTDKVLHNQGEQQEQLKEQTGELKAVGQRQITQGANLERIIAMVGETNLNTGESIELIELTLSKLEANNNTSDEALVARDQLARELRQQLANLDNHIETGYRQVQDVVRTEMGDHHAEMRANMREYHDAICEHIDLRDKLQRRAAELASRQARTHRRHRRGDDIARGVIEIAPRAPGGHDEPGRPDIAGGSDS